MLLFTVTPIKFNGERWGAYEHVNTFILLFFIFLFLNSGDKWINTVHHKKCYVRYKQGTPVFRHTKYSSSEYSSIPLQPFFDCSYILFSWAQCREENREQDSSEWSTAVVFYVRFLLLWRFAIKLHHNIWIKYESLPRDWAILRGIVRSTACSL